jgi:hypothetical protein
MTERVLVRFDGEGSGEEDLTWGQRVVWNSWQASGTAEWIGGTMPLEPGTTVADIATLLGFIMSRHQALRTRFRIDADGTPKQFVVPSGEITLTVMDVADDADLAAIALEVEERHETDPWEHETEFPVRMCILRQGDVAAYFIVTYSHLIIDGYGFEALIRDLGNMEPGTGRQLAPVEGTPPLEQARMQKEPSAQRQNRSSLRAWERQLRTISPQRFPLSDDPQDPRWIEATFTSPASHLALNAIAERTKVHSGSILLAAYAVVLAQQSGNNPSMMRILVSNRFRPGFAEAVSSLAQSALCVVDVGDCGFDEAVARTFKTQLAAGMHAYYNPPDLWEMIERVGVERGDEIDLMCYFNDRRRSMAQGPVGPVPTEAEVLAAVPHSTFEWGKTFSEKNATCYLHVNSVAGTVEYEMRVDTHRISPAQLEGMLRGMETLLVASAFDAEASTGVHSAPVPA